MKSDFGERLESLRGNKTQKEFAKILGVPLTSYTNWVAGVRSPGIDAIRKICSQTGTCSDYLLGLSDDSGALPAGERERLEARVAELEAKLHDARVSVETLRETILRGNAVPLSSPSPLSRHSISHSVSNQKAKQL